MNKKGFMMGGMGGGRKLFSGLLGLVFLVLGGIPLLNAMGAISFTLPKIPLIVLWVLALLGALVLIIDGFKEMTEFGVKKMIGIMSIIMAVILIVYGLSSFGVLPFALSGIGLIVINVLFVISGLFLIFGIFTMM